MYYSEHMVLYRPCSVYSFLYDWCDHRGCLNYFDSNKNIILHQANDTREMHHYIARSFSSRSPTQISPQILAWSEISLFHLISMHSVQLLCWLALKYKCLGCKRDFSWTTQWKCLWGIRDYFNNLQNCVVLKYAIVSLCSYCIWCGYVVRIPIK